MATHTLRSTRGARRAAATNGGSGVTPATPGQPAHAAAGIPRDALPLDVQRTLSELGERAAMVVLKQFNSETREYEYLTRVPAAQFTQEWVKQEFGGGRYTATILDAEFGTLNDVPFAISQRFQPVVAHANGNGNGHNGGGDSRLVEVLLALVLQQRAPAGPVIDPLAIVREIGNIHRSLALPAVTGPVANLGESHVLDTFKQAMEMAREFSGGDSDNAVSLVGRFAPRVLGLLEQEVALRAAARGQRVAPSVAPHPIHSEASVMPSAPVAPAMPVIGYAPWLQPFASFRDMLAMAATYRSAQSAADSILDIVSKQDEPQFERFVAGLLSDGAEADAVAFVPGAVNDPERAMFVRELIGFLRAGVQEMVQEEAVHDAEGGATGGSHAS